MKTYRNGLTSKECDTPGGGALVTKQDGKRDADINFILKNYERSGMIGNISSKEPQYGDFSQGIEYDQALSLVREAEERFATWPAAARELARNDPRIALDMLADEGGRAALEQIAQVDVKTPAGKSEAPVAAPASPGSLPPSGVTQSN